MGSCQVGSGMAGVDAGSCWDGVASGRGVEAEGLPVDGASGVVGGEDGSSRVGSGTGSGQCSDGPASCPRSPYRKTSQISFSKFSTRPLKSTSIHSTFGADTTSSFFIQSSKIRAFVTTSLANPRESKNFRETPCHLVLSASARIRPSSAAVAHASAAIARASTSSTLRFRSAT